MAVIERGFISSIEDGRVRVTVPQRRDYVTLPLIVPEHVKFKLGDRVFGEGLPPETYYAKKIELAAGMRVAFYECEDTEGAVLAVLEETT